MNPTARPSPADLAAAAAHLRAAYQLLGLGDDPELAQSPERVAELLSTYAPQPIPPADPLPTTSDCGLITLRDLPFHSLCAHHLLPFFGSVHLAFRPMGRLVGLGWLSRAVAACAQRPQLQERLADDIFEAIKQVGAVEIGVRIVARQLCVEMRGPRTTGNFEVLRLSQGASADLRAALR